MRSKTTIREHLQKEDVQERILQYIQKGRDEATVTISRAAELFGITENKLRDWEEYGILNPLRPSGPKGRRLYTPAELDKLAVIRELLNAGYVASDIPPDIDKLWLAIRVPRESLPYAERQEQVGQEAEPLINLRIAQGRTELYWRYYVSHALRLSLMLISEDMPHTSVGLVLPLQSENMSSMIRQVEDVPALGESLISWLSQSRSSHTLLSARPTFQYSSDYRIEHLQVIKAGVPQEDAEDPTLIVIQREAKPLTLNAIAVETIRRLLKPIYADVESLRECFGNGARDVLWPATDLESNVNYEDVILNGLCDIIVRLGGLTDNGQPRWRFSSVFLPNYPSSGLSRQQRSLIVRAQSEHAPYIIGVTMHVPQEPFLSACIKAFQSGHSMYTPDTRESLQQTQHDGEGVLRSSIAIPIDDTDGTALAVLYVASQQKQAFSESDQRVLRMVGRMIQELIQTYQLRQQAGSRLREMLINPAIVDTHFQEFQSEDDFIQHVEAILREVQAREEFGPAENVSLIAVDIDNQSSIANNYGDRMARDLSRAVGLRIHSQLRAFKDATEYKLYHICADRFYILLHNMTLEQARAKADLLKQTLEGSYSIDPHRSPAGQPTPSENMVTLSPITVRLGVTSYPYQKLQEILQRYTVELAVSDIRMQITGFLEEELALGKQKGGNVVMSWDPSIQSFVRVSH